MPMQIRRQLTDFSSRFLNTTLAEESLPSLNRLTHLPRWMRLRNRDQSDPTSNAASFRRCVRDLLTNAPKIFGNRSHSKDCRAGASPANSKQGGAVFNPLLNLLGQSGDRCSVPMRIYLLANQSVTRQNQLIMKHYSLLIAIIVAVACGSLHAQEKASLQPNASILSVLQGTAGKTVEVHLRSGEKMGGKVSQVNENMVHLSSLTGADNFDAFVDEKEVSAVLVRVAGR